MAAAFLTHRHETESVIDILKSKVFFVLFFLMLRSFVLPSDKRKKT